jgi:hypothetical protein
MLRRAPATAGWRLQLQTLSFGSPKAAFYGGRASISRSSSSSALREALRRVRRVRLAMELGL